MASEREAQFLEMVREFPDSPMGYFSLGRLYLDEKRWAEAATAFAASICARELSSSFAIALSAWFFCAAVA